MGVDVGDLESWKRRMGIIERERDLRIEIEEVSNDCMLLSLLRLHLREITPAIPSKKFQFLSEACATNVELKKFYF